MPKTKTTSPARSQVGAATPRRYNPRRSRSVCSPTLSAASGRLTSVIDQFKENKLDSFALSPLTSMRSVLTDNSDIEEPQRRSWWKNLNENSRDIMEAIEENKITDANKVIEELFDIEVSSQQNKDCTLDLPPDSSDNESIKSIVLQRRKLFIQKNYQQQKNVFGELVGIRETVDKIRKIDMTHHDETVNVGTKNLFQGTNRSKTIFPADLLNVESHNSTAANNTEFGGFENRGPIKNLFGNRPNNKRKNIFAEFIVSESEDEIMDIQPKVFCFQKQVEAQHITSFSKDKDNFLTSSINNDMESDNWKNLPSSTMVENQLVEICNIHTPIKRARLSKLLETKTKPISSDDEEIENDFTLEYETDDVILEEQNQDILKKACQNTNEIKESAEQAAKNMNQDYLTIANSNNNENENVRQSQYEDNKSCRVDYNIEIQEGDELSLTVKNQEENCYQRKKGIGKGEIEPGGEVSKASSNSNKNLEEEHNRNQTEDINRNLDVVVQKNNRKTLTKAITETGNKIDNCIENVTINRNINIEVNQNEETEKILMDSEYEENKNVKKQAPEQTDGSQEVETDHGANNISFIENDLNESPKIDNNSENEEEQDADNSTYQGLGVATNKVQNKVKIEGDDSENQEETEDNNKENVHSIEHYEEEIEDDDKENEEEMAVSDKESEEEIEDDDKENEEEIENDYNENEDEIEHDDKENEEEMAVSDKESEDEIEDDDKENEEEIEVNDEENEDDEEENKEDIEDDDEENEEANHIESDIQHVTHNEELLENIKSPEVILHDKISSEVILHDKICHQDSFTSKSPGTSVRKTEGLNNELNIRPILAPARDSLGLGNDTKDSSAEGSGWDSHRTTRKTLRRTFGRDVTLRKSLRTLVIEKSAKLTTEQVGVLDSKTGKFPQANSTAYPENSNFEGDITVESNHEMSRMMRQTTIEAYLQKIKQQNLEKRLAVEHYVRSHFKSKPLADPLNFQVPSKPPHRKVKSITNKPKKLKPNILNIELPPAVIEGMKYKPPKRFQPSNASWITKRLYNFLEQKLEPKYGYHARVRAEKLVERIYHFAKELRRLPMASTSSVDALKHDFAKLNIVKTHHDFYEFFFEFMPREVRVKVVPDIVNKIPKPRNVFSDIITGSTVEDNF